LGKVNKKYTDNFYNRMRKGKNFREFLVKGGLAMPYQPTQNYYYQPTTAQ
jgi:hypothetical protein